MRIVSFYTKNTPYEREAKRLRANLESLQIPHHIEGIESKGSWEENCAYKPQFLLSMWEKYGGPLVWLDVDAKILAYPTLLDRLECDLALRINESLGKEHRSYLMSGTLYINNKAFLKNWEKLCTQDPHTWDQIHLKKCLPAKTVPLPLPYCHLLGETCDNPVITHFVASNFYKKHLDCNWPVSAEACDLLSRMKPGQITEEAAENLYHLLIKKSETN